MPNILVTVVIPTLAADSRLQECVESLARQTRRDFDVIVVDNSGAGLARRNGTAGPATVIENARNEGFARGNNIGFAAGANALAATPQDANHRFEFE